MHRWEFIEEVLEVVEREFFSQDEGLNLLALHGTPLAADPVNVVYLGLERLLSGRYDNVVAACVEGSPDFDSLKRRLRRESASDRWSNIKFIPLMFLAGTHVQDDLMGEKNSWKNELESLGFTVSCSSIVYEGDEYFKGLGFSPQVVDLYMQRLHRITELSTYY